jgi:hypothetical protein
VLSVAAPVVAAAFADAVQATAEFAAMGTDAVAVPVALSGAVQASAERAALGDGAVDVTLP